MRWSRLRALDLFIALTLIFLLALTYAKWSWPPCSWLSTKGDATSEPGSFSTGNREVWVIEPRYRTVLRMFHIYNETLSEIEAALRRQKVQRLEIDENTPRANPNISILPSTISPQLLVLNHNNSSGSGVSRDVPHVLECVRFVGPPEMNSPKICIHPPETDQVISMFLRDRGHWEIDHVSEMEWALLTYRDMQLMDLGCNVGVFTLYAAGMGRHVVAVDAVMKNLQLLRASLTLNDVNNHHYIVHTNAASMYPTRAEAKEIIIGGVRSPPQVSSTVSAHDNIHLKHSSSSNNNINNNNNNNNKQHRDINNKKDVDGDDVNEDESQVTTKTLSISQLVTVLHNAVYKDRTRLAVLIKPDKNYGGAGVRAVSSPSPGSSSKLQNLTFVEAICLDDLLPFVTAPSVFLKMDIEGSEPDALQCAQRFFEKLHVRYVLMEWLYQLGPASDSQVSAPFVINFFTAKGFIPTKGVGLDVKGGAAADRGVKVLDVNQWHRWPEVVLWMER